MVALGQDVLRLARLSSGEQRLLAEASASLTIASAAIAWLPFQRALRLGSGRVANRRSSRSVAEVVWAVKACASRLPVRAKCIEQGIAAQRLLRRAGFDAKLHYGARQAGEESRKLEAHVWVTVDGVAVIGEEQKDDFAEVACYP